MYLDLLAERNPAELARLRKAGDLESVASEIQGLFEQQEVDLTKQIATANLEGREPNSPGVPYQESVQALNMGAMTAREILANDLAEMVGPNPSED